MESWWSDIRHGARLLRALPYADADRIAILWQRSPGLNVTRDWLSVGQCLDIAAESRFRISYWVEQRTSEIGIRVALGAERADILHLVTREFAVMVALGPAIGLGGAFALTRLLAGMLFGISATDLTTFGVIPLVLTAVALVATLAPLRRAMRIEPVIALRYE